MRIFTRYLLRLHLAPFLFAVTGLTLLLLLDQVSKRFKDLIGKNLEWWVIAEVFLHSIPFILAQTLPMAVLIAVLYTFNRLEGDFEITAIRASGIPLRRVMAPVFVASVILAGGMTWFNDTVLPESNHELQVLLTSIGRKKPTFYLRERAINEVLPSRLYVQPGGIDREQSSLQDAVLYDERDGQRSRTIYADHGTMAFDGDGEDLYLDLTEGTLQERPNERPHAFQRIFFGRMVMRVEDVSNQLERDTLNAFRSDREMDIAQMRGEVRLGEERAEAARNEARGFVRALTRALTEFREPLETESDSALGQASGPYRGGARGPDELPRGPMEQPSTTDAAPPVDTPTAARTDSSLLLGEEAAQRANSAVDAVNQLRAYREREINGLDQINKFLVEIYKKGSIPAACIVFVLIGAPIAVRYPRAGVALVVGVSLVFFAAYYVSLVGGEELADRRFISPFWAMWAPNVLFGIFGVVALWRATRVTR